jgi:hypothetical protein
MAEDKSNRESGGSGSRRRYFRRRSQVNKAAPNPSNAPPRQAPPPKPNGHEKAGLSGRAGRLGKRRRRSRNRANDLTVKTAPAESIANLGDYAPPADVFIYTHISRPGSRDSYEFRADHFSRVGRRLEDYEIDLSKLIADEGGEVIMWPERPALIEDEFALDEEPDLEAE